MRRTINAATMTFCLAALAACGSEPIDGLSEMGEAQFGIEAEQEATDEALFAAGHARRMAGLELTEEQQAQLDALEADMEEELTAAKDAMQQLRDEMLELWTAEQPDERAILDKHAEMEPIRDEIVERRFEFRLAVIALLTSEQRDILSDRCGTANTGESQGSGGQTSQQQGQCGGQNGGGGGGGGSGRGMGKQLDLSLAQRTQIMSLKAEMQEDLAEVRADMQQIKLEMCELWSAEGTDIEALLAKREEAKSIGQQVLSQRIGFRLAVFDLLTPEQRAAMSDLINSRQEQRRSQCQQSSD